MNLFEINKINRNSLAVLIFFPNNFFLLFLNFPIAYIIPIQYVGETYYLNLVHILAINKYVFSHFPMYM